ncbi:MAG TPA: LysR family transcriptional regulator, partial [Dehalococcoidia bacterium]|nr:LysR family transcriptional regulator [Dehalococcoidia bacterium]
MSLQKLRIFLTVADKGKFSKAGDQLDITQPAVSLQIKEFELF